MKIRGTLILKVVFLDFDGVLNRGAGHFDPRMVAELNRICAIAGASIVIHSSWRYGRMATTILDQLSQAPDSQLSARLVKQTKEFWAQDPKPSLVEQYDYLVILGRTSCCEASGFIKTLCLLDEFYERPGGPREEPYPEPTLHLTTLESPDAE